MNNPIYEDGLGRQRSTTPTAPRSSRITSRNHVAKAVLALISIGVMLMITRSPASAQVAPGAVHEVGIGRFIEGVPAESIAFYPSSLKVRSGDVIHYTGEDGPIPETGVHGVLALPVGEEPAAWEQENAKNLDGEWAFFLTDPDDDPGEAPSALKGNWKAILPTDLSCGSAENPCVTGTSPASRSPLNSGLGAPLDYHLKIEAEPGTRLWFMCPVHGPAMKLKVDAVSDDEATTTPEEIQQRNEAKLLRTTEKAKRLHRTFSARRTSILRRDGTRLWDAWPGVERDTVSLFGMYPKTLSIRKNDSVRWHFEQVKFESHSVTFPLSNALDVHNAPWGVLMCDGDTDEGPAPDVEPPPGAVCPSPPSDVWEFDIHPRFYFPQGDGNLRGTEYESSGFRGPLAGMPHQPYRMRFPQGSGLTTFDYGCQMHPTMRGSVKVR